MHRLISLTVGTFGAEDYASAFMDIGELAGALGSQHDYVSVSAQVVNDDEPEPEHERLHHDENTLNKVRKALMEHGLSSDLMTSAITDMQNAGILFRERPPTEER